MPDTAQNIYLPPNVFWQGTFTLTFCSVSSAQGPSRPRPHGNIRTRYSKTQKAQVLALCGLNIPTPIIQELTKVPQGTICLIRRRALARGWNPTIDQRVLDHYIDDGKRPGRPKKDRSKVVDNEADTPDDQQQPQDSTATPDQQDDEVVEDSS